MIHCIDCIHRKVCKYNSFTHPGQIIDGTCFDYKTCDVVPRSEVEKAKQEVAREIFYLIDNYIEIVKTTVGFDLEFLINSIAELKKKYEVTKNEN